MIYNVNFHHIGVPTDKSNLSKKARYSPLFKMYSEDAINDLGIHIEYHAFESGSPLDRRITREKHIAFKVDNIEDKLQGREILMPLYEPFKGYKCAMILVNDVLIELIETSLSEKEIWEDEEILKNGILYNNSL